jgi:hypothetical protein
MVGDLLVFAREDLGRILGRPLHRKNLGHLPLGWAALYRLWKRCRLTCPSKRGRK